MPIPFIAMPIPFVAMPIPFVAIPIPFVAMPIPFVAMPIPLVAMTIPFVAMPIPFVAMPIPFVAMPIPFVAMIIPFVAMPIPFVAMPIPFVAMTIPFVAMPTSFHNASCRTHASMPHCVCTHVGPLLCTHTQVETALVCQDTGAVLHGPLPRYQPMPGGSRIIMAKAEVDQVKAVCPHDLLLLGFKPVHCLKDYHNLQPPTFLFPDEETLAGSTAAFIAMHNAMLDANSFALACWAKISLPRLVAILPQQEQVDESGTQVQPAGWHMIPLPFYDDVRPAEKYARWVPGRGANDSGGDGEEAGSKGEVVSAPRADAGQVATATALMRYMHLKTFSPLDILNPVIQTHYSMLEAIALDLPEVQPVVDTTLPDYTIFQPLPSDTTQPKKKGKAARATAALRHFKDAVYGSGHDEEEGQRDAAARARADAAERKRKATFDAATAKAGVVDWRGLAEKGKELKVSSTKCNEREGERARGGTRKRAFMESPPSPPSPSDALLLRQGGKPLPPASQCFPWRPHHFSARLTPHGASSPGGSSAVPHARGNTPTCYGTAGSPLPFARVLELMARRRRARSGGRHGSRPGGGRTPVNSQRRHVSGWKQHSLDREGPGESSNGKDGSSREKYRTASARDSGRGSYSGSGKGSGRSSSSRSRSASASPRHRTSGALKEPAGSTITDTSAVRTDLSKRLEACRTQQASQGSTDSRALVSGAGEGRGEAGGADRAEAQARAVQADEMGGRPEDLAQRARLAEAQVDMAELQAQVVCAELQWIRSAVERQEAGVAAVLAELAGLRQRVHHTRRCAEGENGAGGAQGSGEGGMREVQQVEAAVASAEARLWRVEAAAADARASLIALGGEAGEMGGLAGIDAREGGNIGGLCGDCWCEAGLETQRVGGVVGMGMGCGGEVCAGMRGCAGLEGYGVGEVGLSAAEFAVELQRRLEEVQKELVAKGQGHRVTFESTQELVAKGQGHRVTFESTQELVAKGQGHRVVEEKEGHGGVEEGAGGYAQPVEGEGEQSRVQGTERVRGLGQATGGGIVTDGVTVCEKACEEGTRESKHGTDGESLLGKQPGSEDARRDGELVRLEGEESSGAGELRFWDRIGGESKLLAGGSVNGGVTRAAADSAIAKDFHRKVPVVVSASASHAKFNSTTQMQQNQRASVVMASLAVQPERRKRASECYAVLGLTARAGADEIRQAYRRLARIYHPDTNSSEDTVPKFLEVHEAYKIALRRQEKAQAKALLESQSPPNNSRPLKTSGKPRIREDWDDIWDDILGSTTQRKTPKRR
ncbi:unnamed protein product [Closterium sp. NIES-53]